MTRYVWVQFGADGLVVRIFKNRKQAFLVGGTLGTQPRAKAVTEVRQQIYRESGGECRRCGKPVSYDREGPYEPMEMHEEHSRGKGGDISIWNSVALCHNCHTGSKNSAHGNRRPRFGEYKNV